MGRVTDKKTGKRTIVAIKSIINDKPDVSPEELDYEFDNFLKEIKRSQILGIHPNVVGYIGAVTVDLSQCKKEDVIRHTFNLKKSISYSSIKVSVIFSTKINFIFKIMVIVLILQIVLILLSSIVQEVI